MPVRSLSLAALAVAVTIAALPSSSRAQEGPPVPAVLATPGAVADSLSEGPARWLADARAGYRTAWAHREAGDLALAVATADSALQGIDRALVLDLDAPTRRDLVDIRARISGMRDAARHEYEEQRSDQQRRASDPESGPADRSVLDAPAVEDIEPQFNADVYRYIEYFTGNGRSVFERWLRRSGRYMELFRDVLQREGLPPDLVHLVFVESGFNVHARSVSAAVGPWQFLRSTGRLFGLTVNQWVDERKDPEKSTVAAARYLKHLYGIFGDWPLALASYNAGEGTVLRAIKRQGTTNYWDLKLPRQTEDYVPQFMAVLAISRNPEKYGFDQIELEDPMDFDELALRGTVDLRTVAKLAECSYEELRDLNPAVLRHAAPGRDGVTLLRVPRGKAEVVLSKLEGGVPMPKVDLTVKHRVRRGETLSGIAKNYHVDPAALAKDNGISRKYPLKRGMVLTVRAGLKPGAVEPLAMDPKDPTHSTDYVPKPPRLGNWKSLNAESDAEGRLHHTVKRGETIASIAKKYGVSSADIKRWNRLTTTSVRRGTRLKIRTGDAAVTSAESIAADSARVAMVKAPSRKKGSAKGMTIKNVVKVRAGDTLGEIAARNGTTVAKLKRANGLSTSRIRAGQRLKIPA